MKTKIIPPLADELIFFVITESFVKPETGGTGFSVFNLLDQYVQYPFLVLGTDLHHFLVQSRRPAFGTALYPLRRGEGDFRHFKSFEQVEQVDE